MRIITSIKWFAILGAMIASITTANAAIITSTGDAALTGATIETFDGVPDGDYPTLVLPGVSIVGNFSPMTVDSTWTSSFGIGGQTLHNSFSTPTSFDLVFSSTVSAFGIWGGAVNNPWIYSAYDSSNILIEAITTSGVCCNPNFFGIANSGISRVNLNGAGDWVIFDNLHFVVESEQVVPEPVSVALFGVGLAGLAAIRRRKNVA